MKSYDLTGKKYHRLTGIRRVENAPKYKQSRWLFRCDCGTEKILFGYSVVHGTVKSCGCLNKETKAHLIHGMAGTREFHSWAAMRQRCFNPRCKAYPDYGGRGITVCPEWDTFEGFYRDMGSRPARSSLDRIDNNGGYNSANCRWADHVEQCRNRRTTTFYSHEGKTKSLQEWGEEVGVSYQTMWQRYRTGKRGDVLLSSIVRGGPKRKAQPQLGDA